MRRPPAFHVRALAVLALFSALAGGAILGQDRLVEVLRARLAANPRDAATLEQLGAQYLRQGDHAQAFIQLHKALAVDSDRARPFYYLGLLYAQKGLYFKEIEAYQKALVRAPDFLPAHLNLGHAYLSVGKIAEAVEQYRWVERRDPRSLTVLYNLGIVFADLNRPAEARRYLNRVLLLAAPQDPAREKAARILAEIDRKR